ncbi:MAG: sigma-54 dependent transcriptional regulator [Desulfurivibrionaceae bacterium]|nr:sigma-54 dependent transcriptional regulator [Desulfobulbales bacterium]MDT8335061.1 sigma-54 dependent transcriptional regulator [Desulfurivibrionaceae bacterium]
MTESKRGCPSRTKRPGRASGDAIIGDSRGMKFLKAKLDKIALVNAPVLIGGESGTGKELVAMALHGQSPRADRPFKAINCAALPSTLIQSELFGHEKGAFTDACNLKKGLFEIADGGTIFLDEIGDLPLELQVILLRVLEEEKIRRVGGTEDIEIDVRIVAATHIDLERAVAEGGFREDLFYRLNILELILPPLRERGEDIDLLADHFLAVHAGKNANSGLRYGIQTRQLMRNYSWPGNVRELINRIQRAAVMAEETTIKPADLGLERREYRRMANTLKGAREEAERIATIQALRRAGNQVAAAARELGTSRVTVYRLIEKYGIEI